MTFCIAYHTKSLFLSVNVFEKELNIGGFALTFRLAERFAEFEDEAALKKTDAVVEPDCCTWP